ncbi:hypothetical protein RMATCC62417_16838 [Rhizopus microsporus]|nr:hypothetical protein RMATCC62417_16838 [Rhizopus microsporus]
MRPPSLRMAILFIVVDNRRVVPYNPYLTKKYKAHTNVEICTGVEAVKYVNKYIYKGSDRTTLQIEDTQDEIKKYLHPRYIGPSEAMWNLFQFKTHEEDPTVISLQAHLQGQQAVYFPSETSATEIARILERNRATLMAFFKYNARNEDGRLKRWRPRQRGFAIGRMYHYSPIAGERYCLRLLLTSVCSSKSFEDIRTVNGVLYPTFREACMVLHLVQDDREWDRCFAEARLFATGRELRRLFVTALLQAQLSNPLALWERYCSDICDDISNRLINLLGDHFTTQLLQQTFMNGNLAIDYGLYLLDDKLWGHGKSLQMFNLPGALCDWQSLLESHGGRQRERNPLIRRALDFDSVLALADFNRMHRQLNQQQKDVFNAIVRKIEFDPSNSQFFLQGPASTGKTLVYNTLCNHYKSKNEIVLCVASSGIAALLLSNGQTSHLLYKIPLSIDECSICNIRKDSYLAGLIKRAKLIIWDEVPMQHKYCFEAAHRTLQDICDDLDESYLVYFKNCKPGLIFTSCFYTSTKLLKNP